jgi:hypothetical protein
LSVVARGLCLCIADLTGRKALVTAPGLPHVPAELRTERLLLRRWHAGDAEPLARIYGRREYLEHMPPLDLEETRAQLARYEDSGYDVVWYATERLQ